MRRDYDYEGTSDSEFGWEWKGHSFRIVLRRVTRRHMRCIVAGLSLILVAIAGTILAVGFAIIYNAVAD